MRKLSLIFILVFVSASVFASTFYSRAEARAGNSIGVCEEDKAPKVEIDPEPEPAIPTEVDKDTLLQEQEVITLLNQERRRFGLSPVTHNDRIGAAAIRHSGDMARNNFMSHTGSDGSTPFSRMRDAGYNYRTAAENVAAGHPSAEAVVRAWMNSAGHRQNMLNAGFCDVGVGYDHNERTRMQHYWTLKLCCQ
jgi:uncharacterized protein YkwD